MLISIITATYNSVQTIESAILSASNQDFPVEHIIIDNFSKDGTIDVLKRFANLRWISEPDKGVYDALNKGLNMAKGDWIYILGSDDQLTPNIFSQLSRYLETPSLSLIYGDVFIRKTNSVYGGQFDLNKFLINNPCQQSILYRKELFLDKRFDTKYPISADYAFNIPLFIDSTVNKQYVPTIFAIYDGNGLSETTVDGRFLKDKIELFCNVANMRRSNSYFDLYRHQEAINQILYGNLFIGWIEMGIYSLRTKVFIKNLRTAVGMTKARLIRSIRKYNLFD